MPKKNILKFLGKPIIAYTIEATLETQLFEKVVVSTEDNEIASISKQYGADIAFRPQELAGDQARVVDVCANLLISERDSGRHYELFCCLYATAPMRKAEDIRRTVDLVEGGQADFAIAVTEYFFPPHQALFENPSDYLAPVWPDWNEKKSQELPVMFIDNGSTYVAWVDQFMKHKSFYGERLKGHFMPRIRSIDIDNKEDFLLAEKLAELKRL